MNMYTCINCNTDIELLEAIPAAICPRCEAQCYSTGGTIQRPMPDPPSLHFTPKYHPEDKHPLIDRIILS